MRRRDGYNPRTEKLHSKWLFECKQLVFAGIKLLTHSYIEFTSPKGRYVMETNSCSRLVSKLGVLQNRLDEEKSDKQHEVSNNNMLFHNFRYIYNIHLLMFSLNYHFWHFAIC